MKKYVVKIFIPILLLILAVTYVQAASNKTISKGVIQPWESPFLELGKYKQAIINPINLADLKNTAKKMLAEKQNLNPGQMFALSSRLYSLGAKDEGVYWFYYGQYRARLFRSALKDYKSVYGRIGNRTFELWSAYSAFMRLNGVYLNGYAGCDPDKLLAIIRKVQRENKKVPALDKIFGNVKFKAKEKWPDINSKISTGMNGLIKQIEKKKPNWKQIRAQNKADEKYCN